VAEVVASHLVEAYEADTDAADAPGLRDRARDALVRAGDHAASLGAGESAQHYFESALLLAVPADRAALLVRAGEMAWLQVNAEVARQHLEEAVALHTAAGQIGAAARVSVTLAALDAHELKVGQAADRMERAFAALQAAEATGLDHETDLAVIAAEAGRRLFLAGRTQDVAIERLELALGIAERKGDSQVFCEAINTKGLILGERGRRQEGRALLTAALDHALAADLHDAALRAYNNLAADTQGSDPVRASAYVQAGTALARLMGRRLLEVMFVAGEMCVLVDLGRWDAAIRVVTELLGTDEQWISESELANELVVVGWVYLWRGQISGARSIVERLDDVYRRSAPDTQLLYDAVRAGILRAQGRNGDAVTLLADANARGSDAMDYLGLSRWVLIESVEAAFAAGDLQSVRRQLDLAAARLTPVVAPIVHAHIQRFHARLAAAEDRNADIVPNFQAAIEAFQQRQLPFWLAVTRLELAEWLLQHGKPADADGMLAEARATFAELGAAPWLKRADDAVAGPSTSKEQTALPA
jgi:tetratricopeptide (TPR) repeat protein